MFTETTAPSRVAFLPKRFADVVDYLLIPRSVMIRNYRPDDVPKMLSVIKAAFAEQKGIVNPPSSAERKTLEILSFELEAGEALVFEIDTRIIGCVCYREKDESIYFDRLAVLPAFRRRGIGKRLIREIENRAGDRGFQTITLSVRIELEAQQEYYQRLGYRIDSYKSHEGFEDPTYLIMKKSLIKRRRPS